MSAVILMPLCPSNRETTTARGAATAGPPPPARRETRLALGEASVAELAKPFGISQPAVSKHLKILERAELIAVRHDAQRRPRRIQARPLAEAHAWIERYRDLWETSFQRLDALLEELQAKPGNQHDKKRRQRR